ncbi:hypothetical protein Btru_044175 [Bulinus truncatus]|nr:hypothetical protein Btru_044175 [Bulinus truncatus]
MVYRGLSLLLVASVLVVISSQRKQKGKGNQDDYGPPCQLQQPTCGLCGRPINVTLVAKNILQPPFFQFSANVLNEPKRELLSFLEKAAELDARFKFTSTYFRGLGYFIDSINGVVGSIPNQTFWHFSSNGTALQCGATSYVPRDGESVLFNFTTYAEAGH